MWVKLDRLFAVVARAFGVALQVIYVAQPGVERRKIGVLIQPVVERPQVPVDLRPPLVEQTILLGRGGQQHKYLQQLIKRWAESKGYRAIIEKQILDGLGSVDVALERDSLSVACEISVSSTPEQELGNIRKCLAAGFAYVVVVSPEKKTLGKTKEYISSELNGDELKKIQCLAPDELFAFIDALEAEAQGKQETVHGYKVKVQYKALDAEEKSARKQAISQVILSAFRRLKGGK